MNPFEEMTEEQLEEGLVRAKKQLDDFLSRSLDAHSRKSFLVPSRPTADVLRDTLKLQNVVQAIEKEIRSRDGEPAGLSARFEMKMSPAQKRWVLENGGAAKVRELIDQVRQ